MRFPGYIVSVLKSKSFLCVMAMNVRKEKLKKEIAQEI